MRDIVLLAIGFGCMVGYARMLALGFVGYLSFDVIESSDAWYLLRSIVSLAMLAVLACAGWKRWFRIGVPGLLVATAACVAAAIVFAIDETGAFGCVVAVVGGAGGAVLMYVWMLLLSTCDVRKLAIVTMVGLGISGAIIMGVPRLDAALALIVAVASAFLAGASALLLDSNMRACAPDGPLEPSQAARVPWITFVTVLACGFLSTVLYGIAQHLTWLYNWTPNYAAFGAAVVAVLALTLYMMIRARRWVHFVWIPQFALLLVALLFACFSVRESIQVAVGLLLAAVFCAHFLHWVVFPALFHTLRIPRSFLAGIVLICSNGSLASSLGDVLGEALPHSMQNLGGVAGVTVIALVAVFLATFAAYRHAFGAMGLVSALVPSQPAATAQREGAQPEGPLSGDAQREGPLSGDAQREGMQPESVQLQGAPRDGGQSQRLPSRNARIEDGGLYAENAGESAAPEMAGASSMSNAPHAPYVSDAADAPNAPSAIGVPNASSAASMPNMPNMPNMPSTSDVHVMVDGTNATDAPRKSSEFEDQDASNDPDASKAPALPSQPQPQSQPSQPQSTKPQLPQPSQQSTQSTQSPQLSQESAQPQLQQPQQPSQSHPIPAPDPLALLQDRVDALTAAYGLTPREQEVAFLTVQGFSCGYIAEKLVVSESTVRFHQKNLYRKLDVHSRNELIEFTNAFK